MDALRKKPSRWIGTLLVAMVGWAAPFETAAGPRPEGAARGPIERRSPGAFDPCAPLQAYEEPACMPCNELPRCFEHRYQICIEHCESDEAKCADGCRRQMGCNGLLVGSDGYGRIVGAQDGCIRFGQKPTLDEIASDTRWLAKLPSGTPCDMPEDRSGWKATWLLSPAARICVYTWIGNGAPDVDLLLATVSAEPDRHVVAGLSRTDVGRAISNASGALHTSFLEQVEALDALGDLLVWSGRRFVRLEPGAVRVAVIDTNPSGGRPRRAVCTLDAEPHSTGRVRSHGSTVGKTIEVLSCPGCEQDYHDDGQCEQRVAPEFLTYRGLSSTAYDGRVQILREEDRKLGTFGTQSQLAHEIYRAVQDWQSDYFKQPQDQWPPLVLNISAGWDGEYNRTHELGDCPFEPGVGQAEACLSLGAVGVRWALQYAACKGALVVAAAGNSRQGPTEPAAERPMYPAAWEREAAAVSHWTDPPRIICPDASHAHPRAVVRPGDYAPLIHAVGALDPRDLPAGNARLGARPRLAAPGTKVVPKVNTAPVTGSSMAAAVVSAVAAVVWRYVPDMRATEVMELVYRSGVPLYESADRRAEATATFCIGRGPFSENPNHDGGQQRCDMAVRRVSICRALTCVRDGGGAACDELGELPHDEPCPIAPAAVHLIGAHSGSHPRQPESVDEGVEHLVELEAHSGGVRLDPACNDRTLQGLPPALDLDGLEHPCPDLQYYNYVMMPWLVSSQPGNDPCPTCDVAAMLRTRDTRRPAGDILLAITGEQPLHFPIVDLANGVSLYIPHQLGLESPTLQPDNVYKLPNTALDTHPGLELNLLRPGRLIYGIDVGKGRYLSGSVVMSIYWDE